MTLSECVVGGNSAQQSAGGGIYNAAGANLTVERSTISDNSVISIFASGGGIYNAGTLMVVSSTISGNSATAYDELGFASGGGMYNSAAATARISNSTISRN